MAELRSSRTKYLTPLLPPGATRQSSTSSNCSNVSFETMSPDRVPGTVVDGSVSEPSSTFHRRPLASGFLYPRHPSSELPSKSSVQPAAFSAGVKVFGVESVCAAACEAAPASSETATASGRSDMGTPEVIQTLPLKRQG